MAFVTNSWAPVLFGSVERFSSRCNLLSKPRSRCLPLTRRVVPIHIIPRASAASEKALIFDCDGVIVESEELHRVSYNQCWADANLDFEWSYEFYEKLQNSIGGGKEKMRWYFNTHGWPDGKSADSKEEYEAREKFISDLHSRKTDMYQKLIRDGRAEVRPGVLRLMDEAHDRGLKTAICSAASARAVKLVLDTLVGAERLSKFDVILAGDDVKQKKPDPMIYLTARERLGVRSEDCVVIEDSYIGLAAARGANMKCYVTYTPYTASQKFEGADAVIPSLGEEGDDPDKIVTVDTLFPELASSPVLS